MSNSEFANNPLDEADEDGFVCDVNEAENYKGIFHEEDTDPKYYEGGAHFPYAVLCSKLKVLLTTLPKIRGETPKDSVKEKAVKDLKYRKLPIKNLSANNKTQNRSIFNKKQLDEKQKASFNNANALSSNSLNIIENTFLSAFNNGHFNKSRNNNGKEILLKGSVDVNNSIGINNKDTAAKIKMANNVQNNRSKEKSSSTKGKSGSRQGTKKEASGLRRKLNIYTSFGNESISKSKSNLTKISKNTERLNSTTQKKPTEKPVSGGQVAQSTKNSQPPANAIRTIDVNKMSNLNPSMKVGRNLALKNNYLNPQSTKLNGAKLTFGPKKEIKRLDLGNIKNQKSEEHKYITSSVENHRHPSHLLHSNGKAEYLESKFHNSQSPQKKTLDTNRVCQFKRTEGEKETKESHCSEGKIDREMYNSINKQETKSRNAQRSNLTGSKSNPYSTDKASSIQSGSYNKSQLRTQIITRKIDKRKTNIVDSNLLLSQGDKSVNRSPYNFKNCSKANVKEYMKPRAAVNQAGSSKLKAQILKSSTNNIFSKQPTILKCNLKQNNVANSQESIKKQKDQQHQTTKSSIVKINVKGKRILTAEASPLTTKNTTSSAIKIDSSKFKTKNNSVNSNKSSSGVNTSQSASKNMLIKNYNYNKKPVKPSVATSCVKKANYVASNKGTFASSKKSSQALLLNTFSSNQFKINSRHASYCTKK